MRPALRTFILVLLSVGLVFGVIALAGLRKYAIRGILIPALIGILLNGSLLGGLHRARRIGLQRRQQAEVSAKSALTISDAVRQLNDQGLVTNILPTGDARFDPTVRIWVEVINTTATLASSMDSEVKALGERDIFSALGSRASIKSEIDKRLAAEQMIEKSHQECRAAVDSGRQRLRALKLPKDLERMALTPLDSGGKFCSNIETTWSLRLRMKQAETALLQFLYSEFGRYRVSNRQVLFTSGAKLQEFNRLTDNFNNLVTEAKELESQHEAQRQAVRNQVQQGAP